MPMILINGAEIFKGKDNSPITPPPFDPTLYSFHIYSSNVIIVMLVPNTMEDRGWKEFMSLRLGNAILKTLHNFFYAYTHE